jgi:hypothetical protein
MASILERIPLSTEWQGKRINDSTKAKKRILD